MKTWKDAACAAVGVSIIAAAHIWLFFHPSYGAGSWRQGQDHAERPPCQILPQGKDGIGCRRYDEGLLPEPWFKLQEQN
jgi:hypothetical protein